MNATIEKVSIIVSKGSLEGIYPALIMANGARAEGIEANLFFTFFGLDAITKKRHEHIKVATVGNPGLHLRPRGPHLGHGERAVFGGPRGVREQPGRPLALAGLHVEVEVFADGGVLGFAHAGELQDQLLRHRDSLWLSPSGRSLKRPPAQSSSPGRPADHFAGHGQRSGSGGSSPACSSAARGRSAPPSRAIRS